MPLFADGREGDAHIVDAGNLLLAHEMTEGQAYTVGGLATMTGKREGILVYGNAGSTALFLLETARDGVYHGDVRGIPLLPHLDVQRFEGKGRRRGGADMERQVVITGIGDRSEDKFQAFRGIPTVSVHRFIGNHAGLVGGTCREEEEEEE